MNINYINELYEKNRIGKIINLIKNNKFNWSIKDFQYVYLLCFGYDFYCRFPYAPDNPVRHYGNSDYILAKYMLEFINIDVKKIGKIEYVINNCNVSYVFCNPNVNKYEIYNLLQTHKMMKYSSLYKYQYLHVKFNVEISKIETDLYKYKRDVKYKIFMHYASNINNRKTMTERLIQHVTSSKYANIIEYPYNIFFDFDKCKLQAANFSNEKFKYLDNKIREIFPIYDSTFNS